MNDVNLATITATLILSAFQRIQEMLLNAFSYVFKGHLDTHLFPTSQLIDQLNITPGKLPIGLSLPIKEIGRDTPTGLDLIHLDILNINQLIYVKARVTENYLMFELHIPLFSDEEYEIYRIIPIPFMMQERLKLIRPSSKYICHQLKKLAHSYGRNAAMYCIQQRKIYLPS